MVKKLTKHGTSLALVIDRPIPDPLHARYKGAFQQLAK